MTESGPNENRCFARTSRLALAADISAARAQPPLACDRCAFRYPRRKICQAACSGRSRDRLHPFTAAGWLRNARM